MKRITVKATMFVLVTGLAWTPAALLAEGQPESPHRIALIDGTLFKEVAFGWGILGHLDKGGHFLVQQADVGDGSWDVTRMSLNFVGKMLVFKNLKIQSEEVFSGFRPVPPNLTFAEGLKLLKKEGAVLAENHQGSAAEKNGGDK